MTIPRLLSLLLPVVLLAPVAGVVSPAVAATTTSITIKGEPHVGIFHDDIGRKKVADVFRHKGRLTDSSGDPVDGATVHLQRRLSTEDEWRTLFFDPAVVTNENGVYTFFSYVEGNADYQVVYEGDGVYAPTTSAVQPLKAMRDFNSELVEKEKAAILKGKVNPDWDNKKIVWEKRSCKSCSWKQIDKGETGDHGSWAFAGAYPPVGKKWFYRASIVGTDDFVKSYSATLITTSTVGRVRPGSA